MIRPTVGDRVYYVSNFHGQAPNNPLRGSTYECIGTIIRFTPDGHGYPLKIKWDNGQSNTYRVEDIEHAEDSTYAVNPNAMFKYMKKRR